MKPVLGVCRLLVEVVPVRFVVGCRAVIKSAAHLTGPPAAAAAAWTVGRDGTRAGGQRRSAGAARLPPLPGSRPHQRHLISSLPSFSSPIPPAALHCKKLASRSPPDQARLPCSPASSFESRAALRSTALRLGALRACLRRMRCCARPVQQQRQRANPARPSCRQWTFQPSKLFARVPRLDAGGSPRRSPATACPSQG